MIYVYKSNKDYKMYIIFWIMLGTSCLIVTSELLVKPNHVTTKQGNTITYTCVSNIYNQYIYWYWSAARQYTSILIYGDKDTNGHKFNVTNTIINDTIISTLYIYNVSFNDAGSAICKDDDNFGELGFANISVLDFKKCKAICLDDEVYLKCTFHYYSETNLRVEWIINDTLIKSIQHTEYWQNNYIVYTFYSVHFQKCEKIKYTTINLYFENTFNSYDEPIITVPVPTCFNRIIYTGWNATDVYILIVVDVIMFVLILIIMSIVCITKYKNKPYSQVTSQVDQQA